MNLMNIKKTDNLWLLQDREYKRMHSPSKSNGTDSS